MMKDLVLAWGAWKGYYEQNVPLILPNVHRQRYVFGSKYPGDWEGEEFFFCGNDKIRVDSTHCTITVDGLGQYWIQNNTTKFKTFVNSERLLAEPRLLGIGDIVFLEDSKIRYGYPRRRHPFFHVKEMMDSGNDLENGELENGGDSPLDNGLILENIMSFLSVRDLKNARLVCKKWKAEATKPLEKLGKVSFWFGDYANPENSTMVSRYLNEMQDMKMRSLRIDLSSWLDQNSNTESKSPREPGQEMIDDLKKFLKSPHNFSILSVQADIAEESGFLLFSTILQGLGEKLVELKLETDKLFIPAVLPPLPPMSNLKKFAHGGLFIREEEEEDQKRWVSQLVPLFSNTLEHFTSDGGTADSYLEEFMNHPMPKLKGITLIGETYARTFLTLLELENPLTFLEIQYCTECTAPELLDKLLLKYSTSLKHLVIKNACDDFDHDNDTEVKFPSFPKLEVLELDYDWDTRISWGDKTSLDYGKHFPSLRKLTVRARGGWSKDDQVFNAFFPEKGELRCETVKEVWVLVLRNPERPSNWPSVPDIEFQPRMDQIRKMFPSAGKISFFE